MFLNKGIRLVGYICLLFAITGCKGEMKNSFFKGDTQEQYNIVFISIEDNSPYFSFYGDSTAKTPELDKLASESLIFDNAFATVGVCGPARSSIITGMYPVSIGTHNMRTGKDVFTWGKRKYNGDTIFYDPQGNPICHYSAVLPVHVKCFTNYMREAGYYCTNNPKTDYQFSAPLSAWDENSFKAHFKNREDGQPFFSVFNFNVCHESKIWGKAKDSLRINKDNVMLHRYHPDNEIVRTDVARNYSNLEILDIQVGALLKELKKEGVYHNTIIFFYSDHGGPLPRGKRAIYDSGLKIPFMVKLPGMNKSSRTDQLISFVDIAPTVLSLAGIKPPAYMQGKAFLGKYSVEERDYIYGSADRFDEKYDMIRCIRDKEYLLVKNFTLNQSRYLDISYRKHMPMMREILRLRNENLLDSIQMKWFEPEKPEIEFYNVGLDPDQINDVSHLPENESRIKTMLAELENWQKRVEDKGFIPEGELINSFWPKLKQPQTKIPEYTVVSKKYQLECATQGSDIVYRIDSSPNKTKELDYWKLYSKPIKKQEGDYLHFRATRIGYIDSKEVIVKM